MINWVYSTSALSSSESLILLLVHKALLKHLSCSHQNVHLGQALYNQPTETLYLSINNLFFAVASISITTLTVIIQ